MPLKALMVISGAVVASSVAVLPAPGPADPASIRNVAPAPGFAVETIAAKGDRLRLLDPACTGETPSAVCADIYGLAEGPPQTRTVELRVGTASSVLIRLPVPQNARSRTFAVAEN